jgi:hypothetical protein
MILERARKPLFRAPNRLREGALSLISRGGRRCAAAACATCAAAVTAAAFTAAASTAAAFTAAAYAARTV